MEHVLVNQATHRLCVLLCLREPLDKRLHGITEQAGGTDWHVKERLTVGVL